jgi:hypothetical protein
MMCIIYAWKNKSIHKFVIVHDNYDKNLILILLLFL